MSTAISMSVNKQISLDVKASQLNKNDNCKKILQCVSFKILSIYFLRTVSVPFPSLLFAVFYFVFTGHTLPLSCISQVCIAYRM